MSRSLAALLTAVLLGGIGMVQALAFTKADPQPVDISAITGGNSTSAASESATDSQSESTPSESPTSVIIDGEEFPLDENGFPILPSGYGDDDEFEDEDEDESEDDEFEEEEEDDEDESEED